MRRALTDGIGGGDAEITVGDGRVTRHGNPLIERLGQIWIDLGESCLRNGQPEQARYYYERVLRAFPGTRQAEVAQIRMGQFGRPAPTMTPLPSQ